MNEIDNEQIAGMKILIVDDAPDNLSILGHILKQSDLQISIARGGEQAIELVRKNKPDLVLLDVKMPDMDGYEVCRKLKADENTKDIPIIFITGLVETENIKKGFEAGAVDYVTKPFKEVEVICRIKTQLKLKKTQDEVACQEKFYRAIVERVPDLIFQLDQDRKIVFANPAFRLLGYDPDLLRGRLIDDMIESEHKEDLLEKLATKNVGPLAVTDLIVKLKVSDEVGLVEEMPACDFLVDSVGIWNIPDEQVFRDSTGKKFMGTLCIGKKNLTP